MIDPEDIKRLLDSRFWPETLAPLEEYVRVHDDHDGEFTGQLCIQFDQSGDAWVTTDTHVGPPLRFRTEAGGGASPRVRNALLILAEAIRLDNLDLPNDHPGRHGA